MFADIHIITATAILVGRSSLLASGLSAYHRQLIVELAWFSSTTHLVPLNFLHHYLHVHNGRIETVCRTAMKIALLFVAVGPTGHFKWMHGDSETDRSYRTVVLTSTHAICFLGRSFDTSTIAFQSMLVKILLIVYGYLSVLPRCHQTFTAG